MLFRSFYTDQPLKKDPLRIKYLSGLGCLPPQSGVPASTHAADIQIVDAANNIVFDSFGSSEVAYTKTAWSSDYDVHEWRNDYAVCRLVVYTTWPANDVNDTDQTVARHYASGIAPTSAVISARAVYKMPKRLLSMRVKTAGATTNKKRGEIIFKNGYNTELAVAEQTTTNLRATTRISISGVAGKIGRAHV